MIIYYGHVSLAGGFENNYELSKLLIDYGADVNYIDSRHRRYSYL